MSEESWHAARLIPTSGIRGAEEQERRATSALLAVVASVREFGQAIVRPLGAPAGTTETFIEVPFDVGDGQRLYPDGLIRVRRGQRSWTALVEVKTADNVLQAPQLDSYLDVARENGFDALLTISNEIAAIPGTHPTAVDKRKLRKVSIHHLSWTQVLTEAVMQKVYRGVADPDQAWILGELIRYLEHPRSGALQPQDMGNSWVTVRQAVAAGTLRANDKGASDVAGRWDQLVRYACLQLGRQLGIEVQPVLTRKELAEPAARVHALLSGPCDGGLLTGGVRIPDAIGPIALQADLRAGEGHLLRRRGRTARGACPDPRELVGATAQGRTRRRPRRCVRRSWPWQQHLGSTARRPCRRGQVGPDASRELRTFRVARASALGSKRGEGRGSFVTSILDALDGFYRDVVQNLRPWSARPPRLRQPDAADMTPPAIKPELASTSLSSQDGAEPAADPHATTAAERVETTE